MFIAFIKFPFELMCGTARSHTAFGSWVLGPWFHLPDCDWKFEEHSYVPMPSNVDAIIQVGLPAHLLQGDPNFGSAKASLMSFEESIIGKDTVKNFGVRD